MSFSVSTQSRSACWTVRPCVADEVGESQLHEWYRPLDLLPGSIETVIAADSILADTVDRIMHDTDLARLPAREH